MNVGLVHAAGVHESSRGCDTEIDESGERLAVCKVSLATESFTSSWIGVGTWVEIILEPGVGWTLRLEDGETIDTVGGQFQLVDEILGDRGVGGRYSGSGC